MFREYTPHGRKELKKAAVDFEEGALQPRADGGSSMLAKRVIEFLVPRKFQIDGLQGVTQFLEEGHNVTCKLEAAPSVRSPVGLAKSRQRKSADLENQVETAEGQIGEFRIRCAEYLNYLEVRGEVVA